MTVNYLIQLQDMGSQNAGTANIKEKSQQRQNEVYSK